MLLTWSYFPKIVRLNLVILYHSKEIIQNKGFRKE
jgi:hypothetical protein